MRREKLIREALACALVLTPIQVSNLIFRDAYAQEGPAATLASNSVSAHNIDMLTPCAEGRRLERQTDPINQFINNLVRGIQSGRYRGTPAEFAHSLRPPLERCSPEVFNFLRELLTTPDAGYQERSSVPGSGIDPDYQHAMDVGLKKQILEAILELENQRTPQPRQ